MMIFCEWLVEGVKKTGKRWEIDYINGIFVHLGEKHNIPTPVNETLVRQLKFLSTPILGYSISF